MVYSTHFKYLFIWIIPTHSVSDVRNCEYLRWALASWNLFSFLLLSGGSRSAQRLTRSPISIMCYGALKIFAYLMKKISCEITLFYYKFLTVANLNSFPSIYYDVSFVALYYIECNFLCKTQAFDCFVVYGSAQCGVRRDGFEWIWPVVERDPRRDQTPTWYYLRSGKRGRVGLSGWFAPNPRYLLLSTRDPQQYCWRNWV